MKPIGAYHRPGFFGREASFFKRNRLVIASHNSPFFM